MSMIEIRNLTFAYDGGDKVFDNVSFRLDTDWRLGLTGRNGKGKTTLLKLLSGELDAGKSIISSAEFRYFPYHVDEDADAVDAIRDEMGSHDEWELIRETARLGLGVDTLHRKFRTLSMGERTKLMLAAMFLEDERERFMLIDEPTNHLDTEGRRLAAKYLASKRGFILVSHDRAFLDACTDHTMAINRADITVTNGNFSVWFENKRLRDDFERAENEKLRGEIKRLTATAAEKAAWSDRAERRKIGFDPAKTEKSISRRSYEGAKSKKMMSRAKAIEKRTDAMISEKSSLLKNIEETETLRLNPLVCRSKRVVEFRDVSAFYGDDLVFSGLSFTLSPGERICLEGANGCGKSTVIKLITNDPESSGLRHDGEIYTAPGIVISYVGQSQDKLSGDLDTLADGVDRPLFYAILRKLDFSRELFDRPLETYSAGQKKKAALARSLSTRAQVYIWDEPLNYIDIFSRMQIEELIRSSDASMIFVEHDRVFAESVSTKIVRL